MFVLIICSEIFYQLMNVNHSSYVFAYKPIKFIDTIGLAIEKASDM